MKRLLSAAIPLLMGLLLAACESGGAGSVERPLMGKVVGLPPTVVDSLEEAHPGANVLAATYELGAWQFKLTDEDKVFLVKIRPNGEVVYDEQYVGPSLR